MNKTVYDKNNLELKIGDYVEMSYRKGTAVIADLDNTSVVLLFDHNKLPLPFLSGMNHLAKLDRRLMTKTTIEALDTVRSMFDSMRQELRGI